MFALNEMRKHCISDLCTDIRTLAEIKPKLYFIVKIKQAGSRN